ncbi:hypothetical protein BKI52_27610 [marine bacterium AO1-C]|nr:hypothetical protein BKI52_27610 [marine bacterium AO1-C]
MSKKQSNRNYQRLFLVLCLTGFIRLGFAQDFGNSPYSQVGIGEMFSNTFAHQTGMGGVGVSNNTINFLNIYNNVNPALLARSRNTVFEAGVMGQMKTLRNSTDSQQDFGASYNYLALAFPIGKSWTTGIGLVPYSTINYENVSRQSVGNTGFFTDLTQKGEGGINSIFLTNSVGIARRLMLGLKVNWLFGSMFNEATANLVTGSNRTRVTYFDRVRVNDLLLEPGISYHQKLNKNTFLNVGATYTLATDLNAKRFVAFDRRNDNDVVIVQDTLVSDQATSVRLPNRLRLGLSVERAFKWQLAADVMMESWSDFRVGDSTGTLQNTLGVAVGGEYTPNFNSLRSYWNRITYRAGFQYKQNPIDPEKVQDMSISFGIALPINRNKSLLNLSVVLGQQGNISDGFVQERYVRLHLGATINDRWFYRPKID